MTPALLSRRYDARFFLARMPAAQTVHIQPDEVSDWLWTTPDRALLEPAITLVYATRKVLESVAGGEEANEVLRRARGQVNVPIVEPRMVQTTSGWEIVH